MPSPTVRVNVTDIENGTYQPAGQHGMTYPTPIAVVGMTCSGSGSQSTTINPVIKTSTTSHHHE